MPLDDTGSFRIRNNSGQTDVIVDLVGVYLPGVPGTAANATAAQAAPANFGHNAGFGPMTPTRVLDSRIGTGGFATPWTAGLTRTVRVAGGTTGVPANATAVVLTLTVTGASAASHLTALPYDQTGTQPVSNLNFTAGQTVANMAIVPVGPDGTIRIRNNQGTVNVIADISGWYV